jgi:hypothetical protein
MTFELEQIFAQPQTMTLFIYASAAMFGAYAAIALYIYSPKSLGLGRQPQAVVNAG